jgi:hypothetical protein
MYRKTHSYLLQDTTENPQLHSALTHHSPQENPQLPFIDTTEKSTASFEINSGNNKAFIGITAIRKYSASFGITGNYTKLFGFQHNVQGN